ncbi:MAG TPA: cohesin domain-containing protein, partial [Clostridia bacterium]
MKRFLSLMVAFIFLAVSFIPQGAMAAGGIRVQVSQGSTAASTQSISPKLRIYNDGSSSVDLSSLTVKYYYTVDGDKTQQFFCDYAVTNGNTSGTKVITSSVKGAFTKLASPVSSADYALVVSFTDGTIDAGGYADVQTRISKSDWTNYNQADDYSFQGTSSAYADAGNIPAFYKGTMVWGNVGPVVTPTPVDSTPTPVKVIPTPVNVTPTPASATPTPFPTGFAATIGTVKGAVGDTVLVPVTFNKIPSGINNCDFSITYDSTALSLTSVDAGSIVTNPTVNFSSSLSSGKAVILFTDETQGTQPITKDGVFANLSFKILSNTGSVVKLGAVGAFSDVNLKDINVAFSSGRVDVGGPDATPDPTGLAAAIGTASGQIGDTVTVPVTFSNVSSGINNCDFTLSYDSNNVELSAVNAGDIVTNPSVNFTSNVSNGKAVILFTDETQGTQPIAKDGVFANLTFKIKGSADAKLASAIKLGTLGAFSDVNLNDIKVSFTSGAVMIGVPATSTPSATPVPSVTPTPCVTSTPTVTPTPVGKKLVATIGKVFGAVGDTVTVPVGFSGSPSAINNCDFSIVYDSTKLDFVSAAAGDIVTNPSVNFTTSQSGNMVVILFTDETQGTQPITKDGVFANLTFKVKGAADVKLGEIGAFCDTSLTDIPVAFVDGSVNIAEPVQNFVDPAVVTYDARKLPAFSVTISTTNAITNVMNGTAALKAGTDYTVSGNKLSVAPGYFGYY